MNKVKRLARAKAKAKALRNKTYKPRKHQILDEKHGTLLLKAISGRKPHCKLENEDEEAGASNASDTRDTAEEQSEAQS